MHTTQTPWGLTPALTRLAQAVATLACASMALAAQAQSTG